MVVLIALLLSLPVRADQVIPQGWKPVSVEKWGGLDLLQDSTMIDGDAVDAKNVLTDNYYLEKRPGNVKLTTVLSGFGVSYASEWITPSGTRYLVSEASTTIYQTNFSGAQVALSTTTAGYTLSTTAQFSKLWFADGANALWYWDGNSTATASGYPTCTYVAAKDARLWCANLPNVDSSEVLISSVGAGSDWVVPANVASVDNAPNDFLFNPDDGDYITCLAATPWGMFVGKRYSSYLVKGTGNLTYSARIMDPKIGCTDNRSVQMVYGILVFLAADGVYGYNGAGSPQLLSREIDPLMKAIREGTYADGQWATQLFQDWNSGTISTNTIASRASVNSWDDVTTAGSIMPSSATFRDNIVDFTSGTYSSSVIVSSIGVTMSSSAYPVANGNFATGTIANWICTSQGSGNPGCGVSGSPGNYHGSVEVNCNGGSPDAYVRILENGTTIYTSTDSANATTMTGQTVNVASLGSSASDFFSLSFEVTGNGTNVTFYSSTFTAISTVSWQGTELNDCGVSGNFGWSSLGPVQSNLYFNGPQQSSATPAVFYSRVFDTAFSTGVGGAVVFSTSIYSGTGLTYGFRTSTAQLGPFTAWASMTNDQVLGAQDQFFQYESSFTTSVATAAASIQKESLVFAATGYYYSKVDYVGTQITSWKQLAVNSSNAGSYVYRVRAATNPFTIMSATPSWTVQQPNQNITIATGSYAQFEIDSTGLTNGDLAAPITGLFLRWANGTNIPVASETLDRRYYLCVAVSTSATTPDTCLIRQKNGKWVKWSNGGNISAMGIYNYNIVAGDGGTTGKVWEIMQPGVYDDDGAAIDGYWVSQDFTDGVIFNKKTLHEAWVDAMPVQSSTMTFSYMTDRSGTWNDSSFSVATSSQAPAATAIPLYTTEYGDVNKWVNLSSGYASGKYIRVKLEDANLDSYMRVNAYMLYVEDKGRQVP